MDETNNVLDAFWVYSSGSGCRDLANEALRNRVYSAERYLKKRARRITSFVQRFLAVSVTLFFGACVLALLVG